LCEGIVVLFFGCVWRGRVLGLELRETSLAAVYVGEEVVVVVEEVWGSVNVG
jgi:hypothetical protein